MNSSFIPKVLKYVKGVVNARRVPGLAMPRSSKGVMGFQILRRVCSASGYIFSASACSSATWSGHWKVRSFFLK